MENRKRNTRETTRLLATAADGTSVRADAEGEGQVILILHPGMNTAESYAQVAARLGVNTGSSGFIVANTALISKRTPLAAHLAQSPRRSNTFSP